MNHLKHYRAPHASAVRAAGYTCQTCRRPIVERTAVVLYYGPDVYCGPCGNHRLANEAAATCQHGFQYTDGRRLWPAPISTIEAVDLRTMYDLFGPDLVIDAEHGVTKTRRKLIEKHFLTLVSGDYRSYYTWTQLGYDRARSIS